MPLRVLDDGTIRNLFGDPTPYIRADGTIDPHWEQLTQTVILLPGPLQLTGHQGLWVTKVRCHQKVSRLLGAALKAVHDDASLWDTVGDYGGCYNFRMQRRGRVLSRHSWGVAIDLDCSDNPFGGDPHCDPRLVAAFESFGFAWGGNFKGDRKDGMHFEFADSAKLGGSVA